MNNRKRNVIIGIILILLVVLVGAIAGTSIATKNRKNKINKNKSKWKTEAVISPERKFTAGRLYYNKLEVCR